MPRIITHAVPLEVVKSISANLIGDVSTLLEIPRDHVVLQVSADLFIEDGRLVESYPFVEVCLFEREPHQEDELARIVTKHLSDSGYGEVEVYLTRLERRRYFENGQHF